MHKPSRSTFFFQCPADRNISNRIKSFKRTIINALEEELSGIPTVAKFATVQKEGNRQVVRKVEYYNLEMIAIQKTIVDGAKTKEKFLDILKAL